MSLPFLLSSMHAPAFFRMALASLILPLTGLSGEPSVSYFNDFETTAAGSLPNDLVVMSGAFEVKEEQGKRFLELPGAPLDTFGLLFGPTQNEGASASARFFGTKQGRKFPSFGISLNGAGGYRLQVSPAKKALEIYKGDELKASAPFEWVSGEWSVLRVEVSKAPTGGLLVQGRAWPAESSEPAAWGISFEDNQPVPAGRPAIWGSPFSGSPIRFDDLSVTARPSQP
jgi:hypothetical protein